MQDTKTKSPGSRKQNRRHLSDWLKRLALIPAFLILTACVPGIRQNYPTYPVIPQTVRSEIGTGSVKVALLLPFTGHGDSQEIAVTMSQAAKMAISELPDSNIKLILKDTKGTAKGAAAAAREAIAARVEVILGPLFSPSVVAVGTIARRAKIPVIAFSTDANAGSPGVYLLSFLPQENISQIVSYTAEKRKMTFAALIPETIYGTLAESAFLQAAAAKRASIAGIIRYTYEPKEMMQAVAALSKIVKTQNVDAILLPDSPKMLLQLSPYLAGHELTNGKIRFLLSGQWDDPFIKHNSLLIGSWYAAPRKEYWENFTFRYKANFGVKPVWRIATLAYDAISLTIALARYPQGERFNKETLTNPGGFRGLDGIFRFTESGLTERRLDILEIQQNGRTQVIMAAPAQFMGTSAAQKRRMLLSRTPAPNQ
ncbi:MAG: penicillin-binding protein activator [Alphaproteobacteria bacterium]|nr:penicillin-binding protein activator [Alphaproteobacteria bacterium]